MGNCWSKIFGTGRKVSSASSKVNTYNNEFDDPQNVTLKALHDYSARCENDLSFNAGDLFIAKNFSLEDTKNTWIHVMHLKTKLCGEIPQNYIRVVNNEIENHESWWNITRNEADRKLLKVGVSCGTYILRPSRFPNCYAVSVRYHSVEKNNWGVFHFKVVKTENNEFYIGNSPVFKTIDHLIDHFSQNQNLGWRLKSPFPHDYAPPVHFRDFEVNRESFTTIKKIGEGKFGSVYHARWNNIVDVALKTNLKNISSENFIKEAKIMHELQHPRIVELLGVCSKPEDQPVIIITEYMKNGSLLDHLKKPETRIAEGMMYLESKNVVHKDLRAANCLVDENKDVKVGDFGLSFKADDYSEGTDAVFPYKWTAPEALRFNHFTTNSDVWSFGVLMYEIMTGGCIPYPENGKIMDRGQIDEKVYNIMRNCWRYESTNRIKFINLKEVFEDWAALSEQYSSEFT